MPSSSARNMAHKVAAVVKITSELPLAAYEGSAAKIGLTSDVLNDMVPGVEFLRGGKERRIILITNKTLYLFEGARFQKIGRRVAAFPVDGIALAYDDERLIFPDGQAVVVTKHQAGEIIGELSGGLESARANYALRRLGVEDEQGLGAATGIIPGSAKRTMGDVVGDLVAADGGFDSKTAKPRLVLFSDKNCRLFDGRRISEIQKPLGVYPIGTTLDLDGFVGRFPDGLEIQLKDRATAERVAAIISRGRDALDE